MEGVKRCDRPTGIRFESFGMVNGDIVYLDNINLAVEKRLYQTYAGTNPPSLLSSQTLENAEYAC